MVLNTDNDDARRAVEYCYRTTSTMVNPIIDWSDNDVWDFLHHYGCKSNPLYECQGKKRIGCVGCPMASTNRKYSDFEHYPKFKQNYIRAFDRMLKERKKAGLENKINWQNGYDVFRWWMGEDINQLSFFDDEEMEELQSIYAK